MRVIENWTDDEIKEFKEFISNLNNKVSAIDLIADISYRDLTFPKLNKRFYKSSIDDNNQFVKDIVDWSTGNAKFPEPKKYYVKFIDESDAYLNKVASNHTLFIGSSSSGCGYQTQFTLDEIKAIDERYLPFAVPVEDE